MTELYLVRHGDAVRSLDEMRPLSAQGYRDAIAVAESLEHIAFDGIYSSPYVRARQTVEPLAARLGLPIQEIWDLRERTLIASAVQDFREAVRATWEDFGFAHPGGETNAEAQRRGAAVCRDLIARHAGGRALVATHGSLITLMLNSFDPTVGFDFWTRISVPDVYVLSVDSHDDRPSIRRAWPGC
jgi:2,3-bisphosphoglycerate-dependent phosphoglycerate mutase